MINRVAAVAIFMMLACQVTCQTEAEGPCTNSSTLTCGNCTTVKVRYDGGSTADIKCTQCTSGIVDTTYETFSLNSAYVDVSASCGRLSTVSLVLVIVLPIVCCLVIISLVIWCCLRKKRQQGQTIGGSNTYQMQSGQPGPQQGFNFQQQPHQHAPPPMYNYNAQQAPASQQYQLPPGFAVNK